MGSAVPEMTRCVVRAHWLLAGVCRSRTHTRAGRSTPIELVSRAAVTPGHSKVAHDPARQLFNHPGCWMDACVRRGMGATGMIASLCAGWCGDTPVVALLEASQQHGSG